MRQAPPSQGCCPSSLAVGSLSATRVWSDQVRSGSGGEQAMAEQKTEKESSEQRKPAAQLQKLEIDFEALVIAGIAAVIMRSPKRRPKPRFNPSR
jgi:transposase-like protein